MTTTTATRNFLVPADGTTHCVLTEFTASPQPYVINWDTFSLDNFKFYPQGAYIDNSAGTGALVIEVSPNDYTINVPAGQRRIVAYPAPMSGQGASITGDGPVKIHWVDYPTFPDIGDGLTLSYDPSSPLAVEVIGTPDVQPPATAPGGAAYQTDARQFNRQGNTHRIAVTASASSTVTLDVTDATRVRICNAGDNPVAFRFDSTAPVYPAAGSSQPVYVILPGVTEIFETNTVDVSIRCICDTGLTSTIYICGGVGG